MSVKCSLFGHRYGDTGVERDREQNGNELVERVRKVKRCKRCGEELVISESKEVTTVEAADGVEPDQPAESEDGAGGIDRVEGTDAPGGTDANGEVGATQSGGAEQTPTDGEPSSDSPGFASREMGDRDLPPARKDDAIILDDDGDEDETDGTEWPDQGDDTDDGWEPDTEPESDGETADNDTPGEPVSTSTGGLTVPEGEFYCPECEFRTTVESSSLREGDFCPECHRGALEHRDG